MSWRLIFLIIVLYFLYRSLKSIFFPAGRKGYGRRPEKKNDPYYQKITDQKIEDIDYEEVDPEDRE